MRDGAGELPQRLRHEPRLEAGQRVAHVPFELRTRHERGDAIDDDDIDGVAAHQRLGDLERLLAGIRLGDQQFIDIDADAGRVGGLQRVFDVDVGAEAAHLLGLGDDVLGQRRLAGRFRSKDLRDARPGDAAHAQRQVQREGAGGDRLDV